MACFHDFSFETPYNSNQDVLSHTGLMFEVEAKEKTLKIETLELDIKSKFVNNLLTDVYVSDNPVSEAHGIEFAWSLVSQAKLIPQPVEEGAIMPAWKFATVTINPNSRKSFYIRMKGAFIDNTVDPTAVAGTTGVGNGDMEVLAGYPLDEASATFPSTLTSGVAPLFAGRFHYEAEGSCDFQKLINTSVEYALAIDLSLQLSEMETVAQATEAEVRNLLGVDEQLVKYVAENSLTLVSSNSFMRSYDGECPGGWNSCDAVVTKVTFSHADTRPSGEIQERMYKYYLSISQKQLGALPGDSPRAAYVGLVDADADFTLTLDGVSQSKAMDEVQIKYLEEQVPKFMNSQLTPELAQIFTFHIRDQNLFDIDSIEVRGKMTGAVHATQTDADFARRVQNTYVDNGEDFLEILKFNLNYPGEMTERQRYTYFQGASGTDMEVYADSRTESPTPAPTKQESIADKGIGKATDSINGLDKGMVVLVAAILGAIAIAICCWCGYRASKKSKEKELERLERKEERRRKKELRMEGEEDDDEDGTTAPPTQISFQNEGEEDEEEHERNLHDEESHVSSMLPSSTGRRFSRSAAGYNPNSGRSFTTNSDRFEDEASMISSSNHDHPWAETNEERSVSSRRYSSGYGHGHGHGHDDRSTYSRRQSSGHGSDERSTYSRRSSTSDYDERSAASGQSRRRSTGYTPHSARKYSAPVAPEMPRQSSFRSHKSHKVRDLEEQAAQNEFNSSSKDDDQKSVLSRRWSTDPRFGTGSDLSGKDDDKSEGNKHDDSTHDDSSSHHHHKHGHKKKKKKKKAKSMSHYSGDESSQLVSPKKSKKSLSSRNLMEGEDESEHSASSSPHKKRSKLKKKKEVGDEGRAPDPPGLDELKEGNEEDEEEGGLL